MSFDLRGPAQCQDLGEHEPHTWSVDGPPVVWFACRGVATQPPWMPQERAMPTTDPAAAMAALRAARVAAGLTQTAVAATVGVSRSQVSNAESGVTTLSLSAFLGYLRALGVAEVPITTPPGHDESPEAGAREGK